MSEIQRSPFHVLFEIEQRCRMLAASLPAQEETIRTWSGIGFRIGNVHLVAPMGEVGEILHEPGLTALPGVKPWVRGVANVRGRLLPVLDLPGYFGVAGNSTRKQRRVLVIERGDIFVGLIVDEVFGMQHFPVTTYSEKTAGVADTLRPFINGQFNRDHAWLVFSPHALAADEGFLAVSA